MMCPTCLEENKTSVIYGSAGNFSTCRSYTYGEWDGNGNFVLAEKPFAHGYNLKCSNGHEFHVEQRGEQYWYGSEDAPEAERIPVVWNK